jgi:L-lactate dehydrogenase complex protein LldG
VSERDRIFANIRGSLGRGPLPAPLVAELEAKIAAHAPNLIPERSRLAHDQQIELFVRMAQEAGATFSRLGSRAAVPRAVLEFLNANTVPPELRLSPDRELDRIPWSAQRELNVTRGRARRDDLTSVTPSFAAIAETGTLVFVSGAERPATLNFLPDNHIVVLDAHDVVGPYEDVLTKLRAAGSPDCFMPRTVNFVTGPSRTADIALTIVRGAHGPRRLHIILIETELRDAL